MSEIGRKAYELRSAGLPFEVIAEHLDLPDGAAAYEAYRQALGRVVPETPEEYRLLELARLDRMYAALWAKALKGEVQAVDRCLRISQQRQELLLGAEPVADSDPINEIAAARKKRAAS